MSNDIFNDFLKKASQGLEEDEKKGKVILEKDLLNLKMKKEEEKRKLEKEKKLAEEKKKEEEKKRKEQERKEAEEAKKKAIEKKALEEKDRKKKEAEEEQRRIKEEEKRRLEKKRELEIEKEKPKKIEEIEKIESEAIIKKEKINSEKENTASVEVIDIKEKEEKTNETIKVLDEPGPSRLLLGKSKDEIEEYSRKRLKEISHTEEMFEELFQVTSQNIKGLKAIFRGDKGGVKGDFIEDLAKLLYDTNKISSPKPINMNFVDIPHDKEEWRSDRLYVINDLTDAIVNLFNMDDFGQTSGVTQFEYKGRMANLIKAPGSSYIILDADPSEVKGFLTLDARLAFVFDKNIFFPDLTNEVIYDHMIELLPEYHKERIPDNFREYTIEYLKRNRRYFPFNNKELSTYMANYIASQDIVILPPEKYNDLTIEQSFSHIVGLQLVKDQVRELAEFLKINQELEEMGIKTPPFNLHMMFLGNPGVGKTTVARIISKVLFDLGYIREDKLIEVTSKDLVAPFGNMTGAKTNKVIMSAMGGVLFIDEAYSLAMSSGEAGHEAIANLVKAMEDYKDDLVCMFAGYSLEMQEFVRSNSGIASRISYVFEFTDYTSGELMEIFRVKLAATGMKLDIDAIEPLVKVCDFAAGRRNFGNGRFVDKLLQRSLVKHATLYHKTKEDMITLRKEAVPEVEDIMASFGRFGA